MEDMTARQKTRVLIADDCPKASDGLQSILRSCRDLEVVGEAADGLEAVSKTEELGPHIILMDAQMPGMDGIKATRSIKERSPRVKVLVLVVHTIYIAEALEAGADNYLMKDCGRQELLKGIRELAPGQYHSGCKG